MISGIVRLADRPVREVMTPRTEVDWIDVARDARRDPRRRCSKRRTAGFPVADGSVENIVGVIQTRDVLAAAARRASRSTSSDCAARRRSSPT